MTQRWKMCGEMLEEAVYIKTTSCILYKNDILYGKMLEEERAADAAVNKRSDCSRLRALDDMVAYSGAAVYTSVNSESSRNALDYFRNRIQDVLREGIEGMFDRLESSK